MTHTSPVRPGRHRGPRTPAVSLIAVLLLGLALPGPALAQAPGRTAAPLPDHGMVQDEKSPLLALGLPVATMSAGIAMIWVREDWHSASDFLFSPGFLVAALIAPSAGHVYAGETRTALLHTGLRAAAFGAFLGGLWWTGAKGECIAEDDPDCSVPSGGGYLLLGGFAAGAASIVYSVVDAPFAAERHNARARRRQIFLTPAPMVGPDHSAGIGLHLGGRF
jgi:hypothetical protein